MKTTSGSRYFPSQRRTRTPAMSASPRPRGVANAFTRLTSNRMRRWWGVVSIGWNSTNPCENSTRRLVSSSRYSCSVQQPCAGYDRAISQVDSPYESPSGGSMGSGTVRIGSIHASWFPGECLLVTLPQTGSPHDADSRVQSRRLGLESLEDQVELALDRVQPLLDHPQARLLGDAQRRLSGEVVETIGLGVRGANEIARVGETLRRPGRRSRGGRPLGRGLSGSGHSPRQRRDDQAVARLELIVRRRVVPHQDLVDIDGQLL